MPDLLTIVVCAVPLEFLSLFVFVSCAERIKLIDASESSQSKVSIAEAAKVSICTSCELGRTF